MHNVGGESVTWWVYISITMVTAKYIGMGVVTMVTYSYR